MQKDWTRLQSNKWTSNLYNTYLGVVALHLVRLIMIKIKDLAPLHVNEIKQN